jgi:hypothetical protein
MTVEAVPWALNGESTDADVARHAFQGLLGGVVGSFSGGVSATRNAAHGVCTPGSLLVAQSSTPGMSVSVAAGTAFITGTASAMQGPYSFYNGAAVDDLAISVGDATNARIDLVCAQVRDDEYDASGFDDARFFVVEGTPAGSPVDPTPPDGCLVLARVVVEANESTSIVNGDITDLRMRAGFLALYSPVIAQFRRASQTISNNLTTAIAYNSEAEMLDPHNWHSQSVNPSRVTPTIAGWYRAHVGVEWQSDTDYTRSFAAILMNGSNLSPICRTETNDDWSGAAYYDVTSPLVLMNGMTDYLEVNVFQMNTSAGANTVASIFTVELVYPT